MAETLSKFQKIPDRDPPSSTVGMLMDSDKFVWDNN